MSSGVLAEICGENGGCVDQKDVIFHHLPSHLGPFSEKRGRREGVIPST